MTIIAAENVDKLSRFRVTIVATIGYCSFGNYSHRGVDDALRGICTADSIQKVSNCPSLSNRVESDGRFEFESSQVPNFI